MKLFLNTQTKLLLRRLNAYKEDVKKEVTKKAGRVQEIQEKVTQAKNELAKAQKNPAKAQKKLTEAQKKLDVAQKKLTEAKEKITKVNNGLQGDFKRVTKSAVNSIGTHNLQTKSFSGYFRSFLFWTPEYKQRTYAGKALETAQTAFSELKNPK